MHSARDFFDELRSEDKTVKYVVHYEHDGSYYIGHGYKDGTAEEIAQEIEEEGAPDVRSGRLFRSFGNSKPPAINRQPVSAFPFGDFAANGSPTFAKRCLLAELRNDASAFVAAKRSLYPPQAYLGAVLHRQKIGTPGRSTYLRLYEVGKSQIMALYPHLVTLCNVRFCVSSKHINKTFTLTFTFLTLLSLVRDVQQGRYNNGEDYTGTLET